MPVLYSNSLEVKYKSDASNNQKHEVNLYSSNINVTMSQINSGRTSNRTRIKRVGK